MWVETCYADLHRVLAVGFSAFGGYRRGRRENEREGCVSELGMGTRCAVGRMARRSRPVCVYKY